MNDQQRQQVLEQLKSSSHVLVTVSANPTVDELAAAIGLTLAINKMDKHATTVFSGVVPSTIEFLQPEKTIETTTDSLRDFIISLDKSKADKLRYKVEDDVVRIFITPYRTTISDKDLDFSQGDFNVDLVIALGVTQRQDLDKAITAHGRILHDATIVTITKGQNGSDLGSINWQDAQTSSFCEMLTSVITELDDKVLDGQMATSLLTGIIAETDRFKNAKTTPVALSLSSQLMQAGANQQLIAEKLDEPAPAPELHIEDDNNDYEKEKPHGDNGELEIDHSNEIDKIHIDDNGNLNLSNSDNAVDYQEEQDDYKKEDLYQPPEDNEESAQINKVDDNHRYQARDNTNDVGKDLFDDLTSQENVDQENEPTLKQPDSTHTPMMQHERVITPPVHPGDAPKSDKPFDPNEALAEAGLNKDFEQSQPEETPQDSIESVVPPSVEEPVSIPEPQEYKQEEVEQPKQEDEILPPPPTFEASPNTLEELEKAVGSPHVTDVPSSAPEIKPPVDIPSPVHPPELEEAAKSIIQDQNLIQPDQPMNFEPPKVAGADDTPENKDPNAAPPVPPPMSPQFYDADGNNANPFHTQE